jgi:hypothetical protein
MIRGPSGLPRYPWQKPAPKPSKRRPKPPLPGPIGILR